MKDVARAAGVSVATVSHVLNGTRNVSHATRERVEEAIRSTGYSRNEIARELKTGASDLVGVHIVDYNPFYTDVLRGIERALEGAGIRFVVASTGENWRRQLELLEAMVARRMRGLILAPVDGFDAERVAQIVPPDTRVVLYDREVQPPLFPSITSDNLSAAREIVDHFAGHGYRNIGIIASGEHISSMQHRRAGFVQRARELGLNVYVIETESNEEGGRHAAYQVLESRRNGTALEALLVTNNLMLTGALSVFQSAGWKIGADIAVAGFDHHFWCDAMAPPLTMVKQRAELMGERCVEWLMKSDIGVGVIERLPTELVIRGSCGCQSPLQLNPS
ncbi:LacI family DNA-binding transcriptional regulator [Alicyclobacillus mali (ex Roth et al. 2021)]|uniref:LacI family DNA-binding transcriptional regulator n=1 Tax=Alicyclobacillus mali (ex Roth et al. 2021) TaxID=1123961 RepID=UPI001F5D1DB6|nr:LacI family DNA-binding transcriptional regulator [Alicyclobacillus mali (ex Roth et al. 2021)]